MDTAMTEISTLSLHDALPIYEFQANRSPDKTYRTAPLRGLFAHMKGGFYHDGRFATLLDVVRSEEHTSELQSRFDLVCRLLLEKKKARSESRSALRPAAKART